MGKELEIVEYIQNNFYVPVEQPESRGTLLSYLNHNLTNINLFFTGRMQRQKKLKNYQPVYRNQNFLALAGK